MTTNKSLQIIAFCIRRKVFSKNIREKNLFRKLSDGNFFLSHSHLFTLQSETGKKKYYFTTQSFVGKKSLYFGRVIEQIPGNKQFFTGVELSHE